MPEVIAIQGELGSNSHIAAEQMCGSEAQLLSCNLSAEVVDAVVQGRADAAVLPIENSLHGSVAEHYDLLLHQPLRISGEFLLRIEHHLIAMQGVSLEDIRHILSHPVALSQCRRFLAQCRQARAEPFYDTAGSVRHLMHQGLRETAGVAPRRAAEIFGANILQANIEDHHENFTRFHLLRRQNDAEGKGTVANKLSLAFAVDHRPGTLVEVLALLAQNGADLTKIESRPVPGQPWEYSFFVDLRYAGGDAEADALMHTIAPSTRMLKDLGRYLAAT